MIGVRSVTYHLPEAWGKAELDRVLKLSRAWAAGYPLMKTQRICFTPCAAPLPMDALAEVSRLCNVSDIRWFNVPLDPWAAEDRDALFQFGEEVLRFSGRSFVNVLSAVDGKMDADITRRSLSLIKRTADLSFNGKDNFRLGLSVNAGANGPFFPFTFSGGAFGFSIALELVQEIAALIDANPSAPAGQLQEIIYASLDPQIRRLYALAERIAAEFGTSFLGFDFSLAPVISPDGSVIPIIQHLGVYNFGKTGTLYATAWLTDLLKRFGSAYPSVGFSGVMYSLLEDLELCKINSLRGVLLDDLIKVSTMCGCGVDMVPLPHDVTVQELFTIFMEVFSISSRLHKPLGIRVLPIPHVRRSQIAYTDLSDDADFLANTKVLQPDINILGSAGEQFRFHF